MDVSDNNTIVWGQLSRNIPVQSVTAMATIIHTATRHDDGDNNNKR